MSELLLDLQKVSRFYKTVIGVGDIDLQLEPGAYGLIGPNGAGKTTLLNLITGMLAPSIGTVRVMGADPQRQRSILRKIGLCPATDILFPNVSAVQWVQYQTALHGFLTEAAKSMAIKALEVVGMSQEMHRPIGSYSLGMRQRVKVAQAIAHDPHLLILDEPFNGLDPIGRYELSEFLRGWISTGHSLVLASHILHEVEEITTAFLLIHGGRILATGDASEVNSMLSGFPAEIEIAGRGLDTLVRDMLQQPWLTGIQFSGERASAKIRVADNQLFYAALRDAANQPGVNLQSVRSSDGSLQSAFDRLLTVHRGETRTQL